MAGKGDGGGGLGFKVLTLVATVGAAMVARKVVARTWQLAAGNPPPANPEDPEVTWKESVSFALLSGAAIGLARMVASREAAAWFRKTTGRLPANLQDASS